MHFAEKYPFITELLTFMNEEIGYPKYIPKNPDILKQEISLILGTKDYSLNEVRNISNYYFKDNEDFEKLLITLNLDL